MAKPAPKVISDVAGAGRRYSWQRNRMTGRAGIRVAIKVREIKDKATGADPTRAVHVVKIATILG